MNADDTSEYEVDGSLRIPRVACTEKAFFHYLPHLKIRELLCWALRTETNVRLAKIKGRLGVDSGKRSEYDEEEDYVYSKVLKSNYLIDLYPDDGGKKEQTKSDLSAWGHDEYKFSRKAHSQLAFLNGGMDDNFDGLTPIQIEKEEKKKPSKKRPLDHDSEKEEELDYASDSDVGYSENRKQTAEKETTTESDMMHIIIPPTLLHFEIVLEAYTGYNLGANSTSGKSCYNSPDASIPRSAIMGGAVVAALTSFQDEVVVQAFASSEMFTKGGEELNGGNSYFEAKKELIEKLHTHFLHPGVIQVFPWSRYPRIREVGERQRSVFSKGDSDIFLQASPLTQALMNVFESHGISDDQLNLIGSYIGNSGRNSICAGDFERFAEIAIGNNGKIKSPEGTLFAFAVSKNAASFILGLDGDGWCSRPKFDSNDTTSWPRTSQFIMLDMKADLLGGLFDFDQSIVACSFDGMSVRIAPRAALSLMTSANFVTPFCLEEHRNKQRVVKYSKRGFKPFLVDPYDTRPTQNVACNAVITRKPFLPRGNCTYQPDLSPNFDRQTWAGENYNEILDVQQMKVDEGGSRRLCCHRLDAEPSLRAWGYERKSRYLGDMRSLYQPGDLDCDRARYEYTMKLFERSPGDAIDFFSQRFHWSEEDKRLVNEVDPYLRMACLKCKQDYNLIRVVMQRYPDLLKEYELDEDILHGRFAYSSSNCSDNHVWFSPSFILAAYSAVHMSEVMREEPSKSTQCCFLSQSLS